MPLKVLSVFGTRPEAIKMAPVLQALEAAPEIDSRVCVTAQHRGMLDQVLTFFGIEPHHDLDLMEHAQGLADVTGRVLSGVFEIVREEAPDLVLVHGDTNTTMSAALAAYYAKVEVGHVEAGLRTGNRWAPWPEEMNRRIADVLSTLFFAPTERAREALLREGTDPRFVHVTGNTVVDALLWTRERLALDQGIREGVEEHLAFLDSTRDLVLVTGHRRESFGEGFRQMCAAIRCLALDHAVEVVYPVHRNPSVRDVVHQLLGEVPGVHLIEPLDYPTFVYLMDRSRLILTDSGGIQEEAPALERRVLVMRDVTERPEALDSGFVRLVGTSTGAIVDAAVESLSDPPGPWGGRGDSTLFGTGDAGAKIASIIAARA